MNSRCPRKKLTRNLNGRWQQARKCSVSYLWNSALQKIIADAGITFASKGRADHLEGRVSVNGKPVSKLGSKAVRRKNHIRVDGRLLGRTTEYVYLLLNKPVGYVSTVKTQRAAPP